MKMRMGWYERHGISKARYEELAAIARQYDYYRAEEKKLRRGEVDRTESRNGVYHKPDPVGNAAVDLAMRSFAPRIRAIEAAAKAAAPQTWRQLMRNVCGGESYEVICPPHGKNQFYALRKTFFLELHRRLPAC